MTFPPPAGAAGALVGAVVFFAEASALKRAFEQRIAAAVAALVSRGTQAGAIKVVWRPASADRTVYRDASGMQRIARIEVKR